MKKEININDMNQIADYAVHIIKEHFPESDAQRMIIQHLGIFNRFALPICLQEIESTTTAVRPVAPFGASNSHQDGFDLILEMDQPNCIKIRKFKPFSKMIAKGKCSKTFNVVRLRDYFPRPPPNFD